MSSKKETRMEKAKALILEGFTNREVADRMGIALSTVGLYKQEMRNAGIELPEFKYGRPFVARNHQNQPGSFKIHHSGPQSDNSFTLVVNRSAINIPGGADVRIDPITNRIEIKTH